MHKLINLTPHAVRIGSPAAASIPSSGVASCRVSSTRIGTIGVTRASTQFDGIPETIETYGELEGLPPAAPSTIYIVSQIACRAGAAMTPARLDLRYPADVQRDERGEVTHCLSLGRVLPDLTEEERQHLAWSAQHRLDGQWSFEPGGDDALFDLGVERARKQRS